MNLKDLFESVENKKLYTLQRKAVRDPMNRLVPPEKKKRKSKSFRINFKEGLGYYKITVKETDEGIRYSYGYFDQKEAPSVVLDTSKMKDTGLQKYREYKQYLSSIRSTRHEGGKETDEKTSNNDFPSNN